MHRIKRDDIIVRNRQRSGEAKTFRNKDLRDSIRSKGLLHPIVVRADAGKYHLVVGGRRLANIDWIFEEGLTFLCDTETFAPGEVPALFLHELTGIQLAEAELEENIAREDLPWQDRVRALSLIHEMKSKLNPAQTPTQTAREIESSTGATFSLRTSTVEAVKVARHLNDPMIAYARTSHEAYSLALRKEEAQLRALLVKQRKSLPTSIKVIEGDAFSILPTLEASTIDLIVADPPYGISAGAGGFRARTVHHHDYQDDPEYARRINQLIITEGFRVTKPRSNLFIFCDLDLWTFLQQGSAAAGWVPFRTPIIWAKSETEGLAPWGGQGFRRTYDLIFYATKGQRGLISSPVDILRHPRVGRAERDYAAAKPVGLLRELIACSTMEGELVLDPCCGSGSALVAAKELKRAAIGIEKDKNAFNLALAKLEEREPASPEDPNAEVNAEKPAEPSAADL